MNVTSSAALEDVMVRLPQLGELRAELYAALGLIERCARGDHKVLLCGNGGSAADADHIAAELMKSFVYRRPLEAAFQAELRARYPAAAAELIAALETPVAAVALGGQVALLTAFANDVDYRYVYAQQVLALGRPGDVLIALSTSGNSANIVNACYVARARGAAVIGMTGHTGGRLRDLCDVTLRVPATETHLVQELHLPVYHALCLAIEERLFAQHGRRA
ncbi:MAG: hypothetical protein RL701_5598 [Pseudomonadota bacterium]|jgi:D-sedoheptulose 7-phosphate isomerase